MSAHAARRLLYVVTEDWYFVSHRLALARAARAAGWEVHVATRLGADGDRIRAAGLHLHPLPWVRSARRPWRDAAAIAALARLYRHLRPDVVHHVSLKPVVLGSLAALVAPPPVVINALTGLGFVYASPGLRARLLRPAVALLLRALLGRPGAVTLLQNPDDRDTLARAGIAAPARCAIVRGAGVDLDAFAPPATRPAGPPLVVLVARMLRDKGVQEFAAAAAMLKARGVAVRCALVGDTDAENPAGIAREALSALAGGGAVEWWGRRDDMPAVLSQAHVACLPSYREGLPKALLEAAANGLPLVATDVPGCREIVRDGDNGLLVPARDPQRLAEAIARLAGDAALRERMGRRSRELAAEFGLDTVIRTTLALYGAPA